MRVLEPLGGGVRVRSSRAEAMIRVTSEAFSQVRTPPKTMLAGQTLRDYPPPLSHTPGDEIETGFFLRSEDVTNLIKKP